MDRFGVDVVGRRALDAGASSGGFTDCLLQRGAASVLSVDVGYGQLDPRLRQDPRVTVAERTNLRDVRASEVGGSFDVVVADLSFISLRTVVPLLAGELAAPGAHLVLLVKPQFEAGRHQATPGRGVIRDPAVRRGALASVASALEEAAATIMGAMASPLLGPAGTRSSSSTPRPTAGRRRRATAPPRPPCSKPPWPTSAGLSPMARVAFVVHPERPTAAKAAAAAEEWLTARGHEVVEVPQPALEDLAAGLGKFPDSAAEIDLAVSLGGDGTMLRTVAVAPAKGVPVLGVNLGRLGYLTEIEPAGLQGALERFLAGDYTLEERMTLEVSIQRRGEEALDIVPPSTRRSWRRRFLATRSASSCAWPAGPSPPSPPTAVLVATPTGSTAYNLSVRGPLLSPLLRAVVVTPISPHMLFDRPLVLEPAQWIRLEVLEPRPAVVVVDGQTVCELAPGDLVCCRESPTPARLVTFGERDFHAILRARFGLADR